MSDSRAFSILILVIVALYVISPVDFVPGPIDDLILLLAILFFDD